MIKPHYEMNFCYQKNLCLQFVRKFQMRLMLVAVVWLIPHHVLAIVYPCDISSPCGCSSVPAVTARIFGGETAVNNSWGWAVSVSLNLTYTCSGTLISSSWVLATPTCIGNYSAPEIYISAATNVLFGWKQWRTVNAVIRHPNYNPSTAINNLVLLRLSSPFNMTDSDIARICLPAETTTDYPPVNASVSTFRHLSRFDEFDLQ